MRRTRFTVTLANGSKQVILAYSADSAVRYFETLKYQVVSVQKGDYRKKAKREVAPGPGFSVNQSALAQAIKTLGLSKPVKVRYDARSGNTNGNYRWRNNNHDIMIKSYLSADKASAVLWHELTHAMQAERAMAEKKDWNLVAMSQRKYSYKVRPIEVEARKMEEKMANVLLCV